MKVTDLKDNIWSVSKAQFFTLSTMDKSKLPFKEDFLIKKMMNT
jgi:hypothetical protein